MTLKAGDMAPDFTLPDQHGAVHSLAALLAEGPLVVFFYPKAGTPVCTRQACGFRDAHDELAEAGARVVGISADSPDALEAFAAKRSVSYPLLSDADGTVRKAYGATGPMGLDGRVTYVIDREGTIRHVFKAFLLAKKHVSEALRAVQSLDAAGS